MKLEELLNNRSVTISVTLDELKEFADYIISTTNTETETGIKDEWIKDLGEVLHLYDRAWTELKIRR